MVEAMRGTDGNSTSSLDGSSAMVSCAASNWLNDAEENRPRVRDYLIRHQEITFDEYTDAFSLAFDVNWPYDDRHVILVEDVRGTTAKQYRINPVFEQHIRNLGNWTVGPRYWQLYPEMGKAVEDDIREFGER